MPLNQRFPRQLRLLTQQDFERVFTSGDCKASDGVFVLLARLNHYDYPRLGLAITKKKIKTAVARHKLKRLIRESFRVHKAQLTGLDIIALTNANAVELQNEECFTRLHLLWLKLAQRCKN